MKPRHQVSRNAIELIKRFEGYRQSAAELPDGRWTIGHGHVKSARRGAEVSRSDAEALLIYDLLEITAAVNDWTFTPLTQNQFDALVCFAFNIGLNNFRRSSALLRVNEGAMIQAACALEMWRKAEFEGERIVVDALVRRRAAEKLLFLTPPGGGWAPAPTPVVRPEVDADAGGAVPALAPVALVVSTEGDAVAVRGVDETILRPVLPEEEERPSAVEAAAAALTERLQSLAAETEDPSGEDVPSEAAQPSIERTPGISTPPPIQIVRSSGLGFNFRLTPVVSTAAGALQPPEPANATDGEGAEDGAQSFAATGASHNQMFAPEPARKSKAKRSLMSAWPLFGLALIGLVIAAGGVLWALGAQPGVRSASVQPIGWLAAVIGVICVASAVYFLLARLGARDE